MLSWYSPSHGLYTLASSIGEVNMSNIETLRQQFLGSDPIIGMQALHELVALGSEAEEALFSRPIEYPKTSQVYRRWLRYVASRKATVVSRLIDRMRSRERFNDTYPAAHLFAGDDENYETLATLYNQIDSTELFRDYSHIYNLLIARGYAGGDAGMPWDYVSKSSFEWEKLREGAFRAACASFARIN